MKARLPPGSSGRLAALSRSRSSAVSAAVAQRAPARAVHDGARTAARAVAGHGQGTVGRADGDDLDRAEDLSQEVQGDVSPVCVHVVFVPLARVGYLGQGDGLSDGTPDTCLRGRPPAAWRAAH